MSVLPSWYLNGVNLATLGFRPVPTPPGRRSGLTWLRQTVELAGAAGERDAGMGPRAPARTITVAGQVRGADRASTLEAIRTIFAHAARGLVALRCVDALDREILVTRAEAAVASLDAPSMLAEQRDAQLELRFWAAEPAWRDVVPTVLAIGTDRTPCPLGGLPSPWTLELMGAPDGVNDPIVHYEDAGGQPVASLALDVALGGELLALLSTEGDVPRVRRRATGGAWSDAEDLVIAGGFFQLDPLDGAPFEGRHPTLRLEATGADVAGLLTYTRRHEL